MSSTGATYRAANGAPIRNLGQVMARFTDERGRRCALPAQVAEVEKPLVSVRHLAEAGNCVTFGATGGEIRHISSGRVLPLRKVGKVYYLEMHFDPKDETEEEQRAPPEEEASASPVGFTGQGNQ